MEQQALPDALPTDLASEKSVAQLVGRVFEAAPPAERSRLISFLLQPLGALALVTVANGIFARMRFQSDWAQVQVRLEDVNRVRPSDIVALADRAQQVSVTALDGLARVVTGSPVMASSAAAALLVAVLVQRKRSQRALDSDGDTAG